MPRGRLPTGMLATTLSVAVSRIGRHCPRVGPASRIVANDPNYLGDKTNSRLSNTLGIIMFVVVSVAALAAIPLMIATKAGA